MASLTSFFDGAEEDVDIANRYDELLEPLTRYSLINKENIRGGASISIHRLVQLVRRNSLSSDEFREWIEIVIAVLNRAAFDTDFKHWRIFESIYDHIQAVEVHRKIQNIQTEESGRLAHAAGMYLLDRGLYAEANNFMSEALEVNRKFKGKDSLIVAAVLNNIASLYKNLHRGKDAVHLFLEAISIYRSHISEAKTENSKAKEIQLAVVLNNLGATYQEIGKIAKVEPVLREALDIFQRVSDEDDPELTHVYNNFASLYEAQKRYSDAEPFYVKALSIRRKILTPGDPRIAVSLHNLAKLYTYQDRLHEAQPLFEEALAIGHNILGDDHPHTKLYAGSYTIWAERAQWYNNNRQRPSSTMKNSIHEALRKFNGT